ncbi:hypothetical protein OCU04_012931 [Sclerotinia nivalis]|uniref:Uncharacterized protein n=1 Tax=Sclerotinia nivalis TaxID=352851 RepID=A0A9X0A8C0_9HELO|nr:hypothetical protein OCU04_012931 [Sclerotinia nivalis]
MGTSRDKEHTIPNTSNNLFTGKEDHIQDIDSAGVPNLNVDENYVWPVATLIML